MKKNIKQILCSTIPLSMLMIIIGESILRQEVLGVLTWMIASPINFILNVLLINVFLIVFIGLLNKLWKSFVLVSGIYITGAIVSFYKFSISGEYLIPADLLLVGEATSISKEMNISINRSVVLGAVFIIMLMILVYKLDQHKLEQKERVMLVGIGGALLLITGTIVTTYIYEYNKTEIVMRDIREETVNNEYDEKGFLIGFTQEIEELVIEEPANYSKEEVERILSPYKEINKKDFVRPNIIMIMSESFFEINHLPNTVFSKNPISCFETYQNDYAQGNIITAVFGGRTCQTEYEVLTGHSVEFTGAHNIAYIRFVTENTPSIVKLLKKEGYDTLAIHAYEKEFFSRDKAYPNLGLEEFWGNEEFESPTTARGYISDEAVVEKIIEAYQNKGENPLFTHVVTMQNHMPYEETYEANHIQVNNTQLTKEQGEALTTYANGINDSDQALEKLIGYFSKVKEPTIIVVYGDHLPDLGEDYSVYKESGYISGLLDEQDRFKLHQTPFLIWNNYGLPSKDFGYIDASYLGSTMLNYIGYKEDPYMNYLNDVSQEIKAYNEAFIIDKNGEIKSKEKMDEGEQQIIENLWILQYHRLFKE